MDIRLIDVTEWRKDDEHAIFPRGARDKRMLWSPEDPPQGIKPNWPYLFKLSRDAYPDQFWMETVAFLVGESLNIPVPKALPAVRQITSEVTEHGALLEWFYDKQSHLFVHASDFFHVLITDFDDASGQHHNIEDLRIICRAIAMHGANRANWSEWVSDMLLLDSLIGNSDRHQENWGVIFVPEVGAESDPTKTKRYLSPFYDNGTSLGHERYVERVQGWTQRNVDDYIEKGCHHLRRSRKDTRSRLGHLSSIQELAGNSTQKRHLVEKMSFDFSKLSREIRRLCEIQIGVPFTSQRADWTIRLLQRRYQRLSLILNMRNIINILEPKRLLLTWQPTTGGKRFIVAQIDRAADETYSFQYLSGTDDFVQAQSKGFVGHPAFSMKSDTHTVNVLEPFVRRLPPRKRKDFDEYLAQYLLPTPFAGSDFALLGYTGAKSPGDGFCLVPDPSVFESEGEMLMEVAGTRYMHELDLSKVMVGEAVQLIPEPSNEHDPNAIAVVHAQGKLGYINKVLCETLLHKIAKQKVSAFVARKNGTPDRPLVYLLLECRS